MSEIGPVIDCDVHPTPRSAEELFRYLPESYQSISSEILRGWFRTNRGTGVFTGFGALATGHRHDAIPATGGPGGSDPDLMAQQLFEDAGISYAVLIPLTVTGMANPEHESAMCAATNEWLADLWLGKYNDHGRYRGSIMVNPDQPDRAIAEIERWSKHPGFVQVMIPTMARGSYGLPQYFPVFEAAAKAGLPVSTHINRTPGMALLSPVGFVSYYFEFHPQYTLYYYPHVASLVMAGVFERLPDLKLVLVEGGVSWLTPFMWRLDHYWKEFGAEVPWVKRAPSEYIKRQVFLTTQPLESPPSPKSVHQYLDWMGAEKMVLFSTDYPHWDFDDPRDTLKRLPQAQRERIAYLNAAELYRLPAASVPLVAARRIAAPIAAG